MIEHVFITTGVDGPTLHEWASRAVLTRPRAVVVHVHGAGAECRVGCTEYREVAA
jgi:hypothetical protein